MHKQAAAKVNQLITPAQTILVIQAENPDGDSLASALALEHILGELGKTVHLYCAVDMPKYLRYLQGWDRVEKTLPAKFDLGIIVDASAATLLERTFQSYGNQISKQPCVVIDHHDTKPDLPFETTQYIDSKAVSTGEIIFQLAGEFKWPLPDYALYAIAVSIISDSGNFVYEKTTSHTLRAVADLMDRGLDLRQLHLDRRQADVVPASILKYKATLLERIEYLHNGAIAAITIPWDEIEAYSDLYNPSELVIGEMLMVENVKVAVSFKLYKATGTITAKIRSNIPIAAKLAEGFGGGGHPYAAGCKSAGKTIDGFKQEFVAAAGKLIDNYNDAAV